MHPPRILVLATILGVLVTGCTPAAAPTPSPTPTVPQCTPEFGGDPFPCTQADHDAMVARQAQYAEAERVYREFNRLNAGEVSAREETPSPELLALATEGYGGITRELRTQTLSLGTFDGELQIAWMRPAQGEGAMSMEACHDYTQWYLTSEESGDRAAVGDRSITLVTFDIGTGTPLVADTSSVEEEGC